MPSFEFQLGSSFILYVVRCSQNWWLFLYFAFIFFIEDSFALISDFFVISFQGRNFSNFQGRNCLHWWIATKLGMSTLYCPWRDSAKNIKTLIVGGCRDTCMCMWWVFNIYCMHVVGVEICMHMTFLIKNAFCN